MVLNSVPERCGPAPTPDEAQLMPGFALASLARSASVRISESPFTSARNGELEIIETGSKLLIGS